MRPLLRAGLLLLSLYAAASGEQRRVVVDFEDVGTWRLKENNGVAPGAWWPVEFGFAAAPAPGCHGGYGGEFRFAFDPASRGPFFASFIRQKMTLVGGTLSAVEFDADGRGLPISVQFVLQDAAGKAFAPPPTPLKGDGWSHYRIELDEAAVPGFAAAKAPVRLQAIRFSAASACRGSAFLDDVVLAGRFEKADQLSLAPIYDGIAHVPGDPVVLRYRVRNALPDPVDVRVRLAAADFGGKPAFAGEQVVRVPAYGEGEARFDAGRLPVGAYSATLTASGGGAEARMPDAFGVFAANDGRPNRRPMWFGVNDSATRQGDAETALHREWMKALGADIDRIQMSPERFEPAPGAVQPEGWDRLFHGHAAAGIDVLLLYFGTPPWTQKKAAWRLGPDDLDAYARHVGRLAAFLKGEPNVRYVEFWNEPDLEFYEGTLDKYLEMLRVFAAGLRKGAPDVRLLSAGVTTSHPREKPGFSEGMYRQGADSYDIAAYHAHGPLFHNRQNEERVEGWLKQAGIEKHLANTESGEPSGSTAEGARRQAVDLVKKIAYSKSRPGFDCYVWFTLQDYWDMDPVNDDSYGLVTSDNRPKPAFVAYDHLIAELADADPVAAPDGADGASLCAFRRDDGATVCVGWAAESSDSGVLWLKSDRPVRTFDLFGAPRECVPLGGVVPVVFGDRPLYVALGRGDGAARPCPAGERFLQLPREVDLATAGPSPALPVTFGNPCAGALAGALVLLGEDGAVLARKELSLSAGERAEWAAPLPDGAPRSLRLAFRPADAALPEVALPVRLFRSLAVPKVAALASDPAQWPAWTADPCVANRPEQLVELAYDPRTSPWRGPSDLSASAQFVHDAGGLGVRVAVTDDVQGPPQPKDKMWRGDCIQVAVALPDDEKPTVLDIGASEGGDAVWCSDHRDSARRGEWKVPVRVTRQGTTTLYEAYLPYDRLGLAPGAAAPVRLDFVVNENDGHGRVRLIQWQNGLGRGRSVREMGRAVLE